MSTQQIRVEPAPAPAGGPDVDPYPDYAWLRANASVHRIRQPSGLEVYLITRYEDARAALADPRLRKDTRVGAAALAAIGVSGQRAGNVNLGANMLSSDPPEHTRLRRLVQAAFTARRVRDLTPRVQAIADGLLDEIAPRGRADLIADYAVLIPVTIICELLGVPVEDRDRFREWTATALLPLHRGQAEGTRLLNEYLAGIIELRQRQPGDDLISALVQAGVEDRLSPSEIVGSASLLLVAGHETTVNLIGNGVLALLRHPEQMRVLRERPELLPGAVEEMLRYDSPLERATLRFAAEDVEIAGVEIPAGSPVSIVLGSAGRDHGAFEDADTFDVTRSNTQHLAFGYGIHHCLGAPLARIEGQLAIGTLLRRLGDLALAVPPQELCWRESALVRGLEALPVTYTPTGAPM